MMGKPVPKTSALIVSAIRKLREVPGSTPREIMKFITTEYGVPPPTVKRQLQAALKRGIEYGILRCRHGHYSLNSDAAGVPMITSGENGVAESCRKRRRMNRRCKKTRSRVRGCVPNRRKKSCKRKRRSCRRKPRCGKRHEDLGTDNLALSPTDDQNRNEITAKKSHHSSCLNGDRRSRRSDRSSGINAREASSDRHEKPVD